LLAVFDFTALAASPGSDITPLTSGGSPIVETRVFDGVTPNTIITGQLVSGTVSVAPSCPEDIVVDGVIDLQDLLLCLAAFGTTDEGDTNNDGVTDLADLLSILAAFGTNCP
jgi:hypothetical protein